MKVINQSLWVLLSVFSLVACGAELPDSADNFDPPDIEDVCFDCEPDPDSEIDLPDGPAEDGPGGIDLELPLARIFTNPTEVLFFVDPALSPTSGDPKTITLLNETSSTVLVTNVYAVAYNDTANHFTGDAAYFGVELIDPEAPIEPMGGKEIVISFDVSEIMRSAMLVIETTHPSYPSVLVPLNGKYFF